MKNFRLFIFIALFCCNSSFAFQYCERDKIMFYDAFIDGYISEMEQSIKNLNIDQDKKEKFIYLMKKKIDRKYLIKSSWDCIQNYPIEQIVSASLICTTDWSEKQSERNKDLFRLLK